MPGIAFDHVTKRFGNVVAIRDLTLEVADGEFCVLLGPSGCGKSTALRMVAGLEEPTEGRIAIDGRVVNEVEPKDRDIAMVFQSYALYPHMTVRANIEFPLKNRGVPRDQRDAAVREVAATLGLEALLDRKPAQLSGGQRQRVALARAIVRRPVAFLMDEPLSNLDAKLRAQTRAELVELHGRLGTTVLYVTHDQTEAMPTGQRIAVLDDCRARRRRAPAGGHAHRGLRAPRQALRRRLRRRAAHERDPGRRRRRRGRAGARAPRRRGRPPDEPGPGGRRRRQPPGRAGRAARAPPRGAHGAVPATVTVSSLVERWAAAPGYRVAYDQLLAGPENDATAGAVVGAYGGAGQGVRGAIIDALAAMLTRNVAPGRAVRDAARRANQAIAEYSARVG